jgi:hypothetical protein
VCDAARPVLTDKQPSESQGRGVRSGMGWGWGYGLGVGGWGYSLGAGGYRLGGAGVLWSLSVLSLVDGVDVCAVVGQAVHSAAPYSCAGGGDVVVLDDLLLGAGWGRAACWTAVWT